MLYYVSARILDELEVDCQSTEVMRRIMPLPTYLNLNLDNLAVHLRPLSSQRFLG
jgi:hypothetical protein